ncbi:MULTISPECIES: hypothetical protein [Lactococcus]|jgi:hypothetical protein|nr:MULTISPECIES: hypothetical protein [Lactococcus]MDC0816034.1 hypothetical protein [Lactococcus petauri]MDC0818077.1 hypothetical protein [Lactococcus petauri]MDC0824735.1 hypothetical protein [Lactococcus petauri]MDC0831243.1 hypothetical protein [Lactococcus petauri]
MSRPTKAEKLVQDRASKEEIAAMKRARENNKETKYFHKEFHKQIARLGK